MRVAPLAVEAAFVPDERDAGGLCAGVQALRSCRPPRGAGTRRTRGVRGRPRTCARANSRQACAAPLRGRCARCFAGRRRWRRWRSSCTSLATIGEWTSLRVEGWRVRSALATLARDAWRRRRRRSRRCDRPAPRRSAASRGPRRAGRRIAAARARRACARRVARRRAQVRDLCRRPLDIRSRQAGRRRGRAAGAATGRRRTRHRAGRQRRRRAHARFARAGRAMTAMRLRRPHSRSRRRSCAPGTACRRASAALPWPPSPWSCWPRHGAWSGSRCRKTCRARARELQRDRAVLAAARAQAAEIAGLQRGDATHSSAADPRAAIERVTGRARR